MDEYIIQRETLTAIANEVRTLSGTTDEMSLDTLTTHMNDANIEINNQENLLGQIASALEGKAGATGAQIDTCTVNFDIFLGTGAGFELSYNVYESNKIVGKCLFSSLTSAITIENVVCGSAICICNRYAFNGITVSGGATYVNKTPFGFIACTAPTEANSIGSIIVYDDD